LFDLLAWVERLPPVGALKVSFYAYPLVNALHIAAIGATVTCVILMDLRILGVIRSPARGPFVALMRAAVALVLPMAALSGLALFAIRAQEYATNPAFLAKMALLAAAGINLLAFRGLVPEDASLDDAPVPPAARLLAALSMVLWLSVLVAGRFIGFI